MSAKSGKRLLDQDMSNARIIQRNLVYVTGLSQEIASEKTQSSTEFFGQYGNIKKIILTKDKTYHSKSPQDPTFSAYITYYSDKEASLAILTVGEVLRGNNVIKASYGTTNYCYFFINDQKCKKPDCPFLHSIASKNDCYPKDKAKSHKQFFEILQKSAIDNLRKYSADVQDLEDKGTVHELPPLSEGQAKLQEHVNEFEGGNFFLGTETSSNGRFSGEKDISTDSINGNNLSLKKKQSAPAPKMVSACGWDLDDEDVGPKRVLSKPLLDLGDGSKEDPLELSRKKSDISSGKSFTFEENAPSTKLEIVDDDSKNSKEKDLSPSRQYELSDAQKKCFSWLDFSIYEKLQKTLHSFENKQPKILNKSFNHRNLTQTTRSKPSNHIQHNMDLANQQKVWTSTLLKAFCALSTDEAKSIDKLQTLSDSNATADTEEKKYLENSFENQSDYEPAKGKNISSKINHSEKISKDKINHFLVEDEGSESLSNNGSDKSKGEYKFFGKKYNSISRCKVENIESNNNGKVLA